MHLVPIYLLDKDEILERAITVKEFKEATLLYRGKMGIYFLIQAGEIIYIGSSINLRARIQNHYSSSYMSFDQLYVVEMEDEARFGAMEILYIDELKPQINRSLRSGGYKKLK